MFGGDPFKAVAAYNAGEHAVQRWNAKYPGDDDQWVENIGFRETRDYVKRVMGGLRGVSDALSVAHGLQRRDAAAGPVVGPVARTRRAQIGAAMRAPTQRLPGPFDGSFVGIDVARIFSTLRSSIRPRTLVFKASCSTD